MKVEDSRRRLTLKTNVRRRGDRRPLTVERTPSFRRELARSREEAWEEELAELADRIDQQGRRLGETMALKDLVAYQNLVRDFMSIVVTRLYRLREEKGRDRKGRQRLYLLVEEIQHRLRELVSMVLDKEKPRLEVLAKVDEIRGLLLDLYT